MNTQDLFTKSNPISGITEESYNSIELVIDSAKAFARSTYQCVYIIDYFKQNILYHSDGFTSLRNPNTPEVGNSNEKLYFDLIPNEEIGMLREIMRTGFDFFNKMPISKRYNFTLSYDFHIKGNNKLRLVNHHLTPLKLTQDGQLWLALCTISTSAQKEHGHILIMETGSDKYYEYSLCQRKWQEKEYAKLSRTECEVLALSAQGLTMEHIADMIFKSVDAIKACKKMLFSKLGVKNTTQALSYAINYKKLFEKNDQQD